MIIFTAAGQLGNQLFQLFYLETIKKQKEKIFSIGLGDVLAHFTGYSNYYYNTDNRIVGRIFNVIIRRLFLILAKIKAITIIKEQNGEPIIYKGYLPITYCHGYFQSEKYFNQKLKDIITIKPFYTEQANIFLHPLNISTKRILFMHVRHGDYPLDWKLPDKYYHDAILKLDIDNSYFILLGDDANWMGRNFSFLPHKIISSNSFLVDLALMTLCDGGIISNSSFAWWGAFLRKGNDLVIAPKYWLGWKNKTWEPKHIKTTDFTYINQRNVNENIN